VPLHTRRIAEAAFALDETYQGKLIYERQQLLAENHGISQNTYAEHRREVFNEIIFDLEEADSDTPTRSSSQFRPLYASVVMH
jgi:hypothetical protein